MARAKRARPRARRRTPARRDRLRLLIADHLRALTRPGPPPPFPVEALTRRPEAAFRALLGYRGPYPAPLHPIDVHADHLRVLLTELLRRRPALLLGRDLSALGPGQRHLVLNAAIGAEDPRFTPVILAGLKDRSVYVRLLVADALVQHERLRAREARLELRRLLALKSVASSEYDREHFQQALDALDRHA
jgi:hypothetical protein